MMPLSTDITSIVAKFRELEEQVYYFYKKYDVSFGMLTCPRCGKSGTLTQKTTVSKKKYKYKKWYFYHVSYPSPNERRNRKQKWCYLNKKQLEKQTLKEKIRNFEAYSDLVAPINEKIKELRKILCPICKKEVRIGRSFYGINRKVFLSCDNTGHKLVFK